MKALLPLLAAWAFAATSVANEIHNVPAATRVRKTADDTHHVDSSGEFRDYHASLSMDLTKGLIASIEVGIDGERFKVDVTSLTSAFEFQFAELYLQTDCCIMGTAFLWHIPFGKAKRCWVKTTEGRKWRKTYREVYIIVTREMEPGVYITKSC